MPKRISQLLLCAALASGLIVHAQERAAPQKAVKKEAPAPEQAAAGTQKSQGLENAHAICIGCHGIPGYKTAFPEVYHVPKIAGQQPAYIVNALKAYKAGERSHPSMRGVAASLSDEDMAKLAEYYGAPAK
jgi:cytochrome c553